MTNKERALLVAERVHANATYDIYPYIYHPKMVAKIAEDLGYDESIVIACLLHDTTEDGGLSYNKIKKYFGLEVAEIVYAVTDELGRNRKEKHIKTYPKIQANWKATVVKICDRIANIKHSKEFTSSKFYMYKDEHSFFVSSLMNDTHPDDVNRAWSALENVVKN
jgi:(p)ppGpp synthase/HD superfamily hydrolase